ncbi:FG-GAP repeat domain-containing protein [Paenarthrobacter sp. NPDC089675]|uniref:FG-GAP repeat domain-containing protein n=1 Tax=Paenarthrobacter sp. NPDC089675 TaxID=3364376 RepID=UPI0038123664
MRTFSAKVRSGVYGVLLATILGASHVPAAHAADAPDVRISGAAIVGSGLFVDGAQEYFADCGSQGDPGYSIQWLRDGQPVEGNPLYDPKLYVLEKDDLGGRISAIVKASPGKCPGQELITEATAAVDQEPMRAAGFTGRGVFELIGRTHGGALILYLGNDNAKGWKEARYVGPGWGLFTKIVAPGDVTHDGIADLMAETTSSTLYRYPGTGDGGFHTLHPQGTWQWKPMVLAIGPGDFDGDSLNDLLGADANGDLYLYPSQPFANWNPRAKVGQGWDVMDLLIGPGDWDGDGSVDVLAKDKSGRLYLYGGDGRGGWTVPRQIGQGWNALTMVGSAGDFDRDGFNDVHGVNAAGDLLMYYGDGRGGWKGVETVGWGWNVFNGLY